MTKTNRDQLVARIDAMIRARNAAHDAQQQFADAHVTNDPGPVADALYEATCGLVNRIDSLLDSVDWQNIVLGLES